MDLTRRQTALLAVAAWFVALFLMLPGFVTVPVALNDTRFMTMPQERLSLQHFRTLFTDAGWLSSFFDSGSIAITTTLLACMLGTLCAIGIWRAGGRIAALSAVIVVAPMIMPPIVSALAMYRLWVVLYLYDTWVGVVVAHTILALPYVVITVSTSLALVDPRLEQAARSLGASPWRSAFGVILPNIRGGVFAGAIFAFIISWDEIVVTLFISTRAVYTLPRRIWDGIRENFDPTVAAVAVVLMVMTMVGVGLAMVYSRRRRGPDSAH